MAEFRMPSLGADMESGTLVEWQIKPGDAVKRGDVVAIVETDKGNIDVEIWQDGIVDQLVVPTGVTVPVGAVLAQLRPSDAAPPPPLVVAPPPAPPSPPRVVAPPPAPPMAAGRIRASPAARQLARELEIDLATVHGTGPGGAITRDDLTAARGAAPRPAAPAPVAPAPVAPAPAEATRREAMRRAIAAAMSRSSREIPHYYVATDIDFSRSARWLEAENRTRPVGERLLPVVLPLKAIALALREFPELNGHYSDDRFHPSQVVHLGFAIALRHGGLVAPALHEADRKSPPELMAALSDLIGRARSGGLRSSELSDPTVTVTSLGDQGTDAVFGLIYPPQVALVGLGRVTERPWAEHGMVGARPILTATLAADHRVSDGHLGGRFLARVAQLLAEPEKL